MTDSTTSQDSAAMSPASAGSVAGEPYAWAIFTFEEDFLTRDSRVAKSWEADGFDVVALYRQPQPTLTDAEREAVWAAWCDYADAARMHHKPTRQEIAAGLRALLARTK